MEILEDLKNQVAEYYDLAIALIPKIIVAFIIAIGFLFVMKIVRNRIIRLANSRAENPLLLQFIDSIFKIFNGLVAVLIFMYVVGLAGVAGSILGAASLSAVVIGFAFKDLGENFIAGVMMAFSSPFRLKDTVKSGNVEGTIIALRLRDTHIKTFDGKDVYVPNAQILKQPLYNYTIDGFLRNNFVIGVDYKTDLEHAHKILLETIQNVKGVIKDTKAPRVFIKTLSASTIDLEVHYWINTFDTSISGFDIQTEAFNKSIQSLNKADINLPSNITEIKNYGNMPFMSAS